MKKSLFLGTFLSFGLLFSTQVNASEQDLSEEIEIKASEFIFDGTQKEIEIGNITVRALDYNPQIFSNRISILGAGVWDYLGDDVFSGESRVFPSAGGDYMVNLIHPTKEMYLYQLKERDDLWDTTVEPFKVSGELYYEVVFRNISGWVDGDNNKAEFFVNKLAPAFTKVTAGFWD
ncbi:hypothetical protein [Bacillus ndiopicus]|uniref:hypothetical protein n=1 Tax=Bacillus ndiopicus TaxID=1347368 RepID=UPI0005A6A672|nr:hypothetical protein [Bacillus ndiopicus]